ncbi:hypothetical protein [Rhizobium aethiopicum]|uniref:MotA/TolQ/ExbB proton channel family protein n=1 Tax=Rhizobium aethiopicum TaxID=1138170 RepID=A0A7W6MHI8_9HYPH|nr:hypothetical protein [Rhizobium aethiopicum]MBB4192818.1 hypothetical protein [Rhizobium aethiopicum]
MTALSRYIVANVCWISVMVWAAVLGFVQMAFLADAAHISYVITALFIFGLYSTTARIIEVDRLSTALSKKRIWVAGERRALAKGARLLAIRIEHVVDVIEGLVLIGLIGNAIGFFMAFRHVDISAMKSSDGVMANAAHLMAGTGTAFGATIVGCVLALWTIQNGRMLKTAAAIYAEDIAE